MTTPTPTPTSTQPANTTTIEPPAHTLSPDQEQFNFWLGVGLAVVARFFIGTSFVLKKLGHLGVGKKEGGVRAGGGGHQYLLEWKWWCGMMLMVLGEIMNFFAYFFAPASVVTPLGVLSAIFSAMLASMFLKERLNLLGKLGCCLCVIGSTVIILHAPKSQKIQNMDQLLEHVSEPGILVLVAILIIQAAVTIIFIAPKYGQTHVVVNLFICSSLGALTVQGVKGFGVAVMESFAGRNEFYNWLTYVMMGIIIVNILFQLNYLNKAIDTFNTAVVTPTYYVMFSSFVIFVSMVLFKEYNSMSTKDIIGALLGFLTVVGGIFMLTVFQHMDISYHNLPKARKKGDDSDDKKSDSFYVSRDHNNVFELDENCSLDDSYDCYTDDNREFFPEDTSTLLESKPFYDNPAFDFDDIHFRMESKHRKPFLNGHPEQFSNNPILQIERL